MPSPTPINVGFMRKRFRDFWLARDNLSVRLQTSPLSHAGYLVLAAAGDGV